MLSGGVLVLFAQLAAAQVHNSAPMALASSEDEAELLMRKGTALRRTNQDEEALELFQRAESLRHSPRALAQIGLAEQALGRWVAADRHLASALQSATDPWIAKNRDVIKNAAAVVGEHLGKVMILGSPKGAKVSLNGEAAGTLPLAQPAVVATGDIVVTVETPGYASISRKISVAPRVLTRETINLPVEGSPVPFGSPPGAVSGVVQQRPLPDAPANEPAPELLTETGGRGEDRSPSSARTDTSRSWKQPLGIGLAGLGLASAAYGLVQYFNRESKADGFRNAGCGTKNLEIGDCQERYNQVQSARTQMVVGLAGAAVFIAGGVYFLWLSPAASADTGTGAVSVRGMTVNFQRQF